MSEWTFITPRMLSKPPEAGNVTLALRAPRIGSPNLPLNASRVIGEALGWQRGDKVLIAYSANGTRLRLVRDAADGKGELQGYTLGLRGTTLTLVFRLPWVQPPCQAVAAQRIQFKVEDGALLITLPDWARKPSSLEQPITKVYAAAEAKQEAFDLLAAKRSVREIAEQVGEELETIRAWKHEWTAKYGMTA